MRVIKYLEAFMGDLDALILDLYDEMESLMYQRRISTVSGMYSLLKEIDNKYRKIAQNLQADEDLFEDLARCYDPQIFRNGNSIYYVPRI